MQILVTGGGGYLGTHVTRELLARGHSVRVFDRFCFPSEEADAVLAHADCEVVRGDIRRLQETPDLLAGMDGVIHLAGLSNDPSCDLDLEMAADVNVESTAELARLAVHARCRRFVYGSACTVYGRGVFDILDEESPANPLTSFGKIKVRAEEALLGMTGTHFEPVIARTATMFGWSPRMRFDLAINYMTATALREGRILVKGGGDQWRPFVHVRDAARAFALLMEAPPEKVRQRIFNVGCDDNNLSILELARRVAAAFPECGVAVDVARDDDDLRTYRVRFHRIREVLGFTCKHSIETGITEVRRELENRDIDPLDDAYVNADRMKRLMATPVDEGGEPVAPHFIPLSRPFLGPEEEGAVIEAMRSGWLTSGPKVEAFEKAFCETVSAPAAVAVASCTAALHLCLADMGVKPGDEVVTSPVTWASTGNTILNMGAKVVFADVEPDTLNMDPAALESVITDRTRAIMPVHMAGHPCDMDAINAVAARHGIPVVEDAAHALGAACKGQPIGGGGGRSCFSFYAIKNITTMEGGMIAVRDPEEAERLRLLATNGMEASAWDRYGRSAIPRPQEVVIPGYKYTMSNVSAAIGIEQLRKFTAFKAARRRIADLYRTVLADIDEIILPEEKPDVEHAWHLFIIRFRLDRLTRSRDELAFALRRENIGTGFHFHPLHLHRYYRETLGMQPEDCPVASRAGREILSLPLHPQITDKNLHEVVSALKKVLAHALKG
jgi:dTDP-4-amino-4,6-dideoxygalactose transaminase/nucleoside-diphosphate-sugar epimerase